MLQEPPPLTPGTSGTGGFQLFPWQTLRGCITITALLASVSHKEAEFVGVFVGNLLCSSRVIVGIFYLHYL